MLITQFGLNWPSCFREEDYVFSLFGNYLPLEEGVALYMDKLESPSPKDSFGWIWPICFLRRRFLNFLNVFLIFRYYLPLEINVTLHLNIHKTHSPTDTVCPEESLDLLNSSMSFTISYRCKYLPLETGGVHYLNKLDSRFVLYQVWLK